MFMALLLNWRWLGFMFNRDALLLFCRFALLLLQYLNDLSIGFVTPSRSKIAS